MSQVQCALAVMMLFSMSHSLASAPALTSSDTMADACAVAILAAHDGVDLDRRLIEINPEITIRSQVLPVLFDRVTRRGAADEHWAALCRLDMWGDGAWHLEMKRAAFDGLAANPGSFSQRYLDGDDCGLVLLLHAHAWPFEVPVVGNIDCARNSEADADQLIDVLSQSVAAITRLRAPDPGLAGERHAILIGITSTVENTYNTIRDRIRLICEPQAL